MRVEEGHLTNLYCCTLIWEWTFEEGCNNIHQGVCYVVFKSWVDWRGGGDKVHILNEALLKQLPHVIRGVDFFHLHFCINVAMSQEVHIGIFYLKEKRIWSLHYRTEASQKHKVLCLGFNKRLILTAGIVCRWQTILTISSKGSNELHFISVYTFFPIVQQANSLTSSIWYRSIQFPSSGSSSRSLQEELEVKLLLELLPLLPFPTLYLIMLLSLSCWILANALKEALSL